MSSLNKINPKIKLAADELKSSEENIDKTAFFTSENAKLKVKFDQMSSRVKGRDEMPLILERISRLALKYNIKIDQMTPDLTKQKILLKEKDRNYYALPIKIDAKSDYHSFGRFLNEVETDELFLMVGKFKIATRGESHQLDIGLKWESCFDRPKEKRLRTHMC